MKETIEWAIRRVLIPLFGLAGVIYEELHGEVDPELLLLYTGMMGLAVPAVKNAVQKRSNGGSE